MRNLAKDGRDVVAADVSPTLLKTAPRLEASERLRITCVKADTSAPGWRGEEVFDAVSRNFYILRPCFPGAARVSASWPTGSTYHDEAWLSADGPSRIHYQVGATHRTVFSHLNALVDSGLIADRVAEPPAGRDWANGRPGTAGTLIYPIVRALTPASPLVQLP